MKWQKINSTAKNPFQRMYVLGARVRAGVKAKEKFFCFSTLCCLLDYQIELSSNLIAASSKEAIFVNIHRAMANRFQYFSRKVFFFYVPF